MQNVAIIVTTINKPTKCLLELSKGALRNNWRMIVIGDQKSPVDFHLKGVDYYSVERQLQLRSKFASVCPVGHYARKNIGYVLAAAQNNDIIVETDDDNMPNENFWESRRRFINTKLVSHSGWVNVYKYFTDKFIWPRGLPLQYIKNPLPILEAFHSKDIDSPIQQGLADDNPDVDAIYRLTHELPVHFDEGIIISLQPNAWCPFNSQNTTWWRSAFPLMYLPAFCSFRMTDIWRSLIAQRISWEYGWSVSFHSSTVWQDRNEHDLMSDFQDEIPGFLHNNAIKDMLLSLSLSSSYSDIGANLLTCYQMMVGEGFIEQCEIELVKAWLHDIEHIL